MSDDDKDDYIIRDTDALIISAKIVILCSFYILRSKTVEQNI